MRFWCRKLKLFNASSGPSLVGCGIQRQLPLVAQRPTDRIQLPLVTESNTSEVRRGVPRKKSNVATAGSERLGKQRFGVCCLEKQNSLPCSLCSCCPSR
jgi:hypothetical protein